MKLNSRTLSTENPPLIIAEAGINHDGDLEKAIALVDVAVAAKADVVKFQCHITDAEMIPTDMKPGDISTEKLWDIIARAALTEAQERQIQAYCQSSGITYLSTPFSREAADRLHAMAVPYFKVGSGECNNLPFLQHLCQFNKPIILSTGMNDLPSIRRGVQLIQAAGVPLALMHCTSVYPTPYELVRLGAIAELQTAFPELPIGISDHSRTIYTALGAVAKGACLIEKHFTVSKAWSGPDNPFSIEPDELAQLVEGAHAIWQARGGSKTILPEEQPVIDFAYASVVSLCVIKKGEELTRENVWVKRPGLGDWPAAEFEGLLGKRASVDIAADVALQHADVCDDAS